MTDKVIETTRKPSGAAAMGAGPGRPKGCQNKTTVEVRTALEQCFKKLGGVEFLRKWAEVNPGEFLKLWSKLLPRDLRIDGRLSLEDLIDGVNRRVQP
ncbi:MAG: hypothetical protein Q8O00_08655 [Holophaga sp.]|nr:hypothetical protein [Holophaga sp.]